MRFPALSILSGAFLLLAASTDAPAQWRDTQRALRPVPLPTSNYIHHRSESYEPVPFERLGLGGLLGGLTAVAGGQLAYQLGGGGRICGDDPCGLWYGVASTVVLEPVLIPSGVHLANHRKGNFSLSLVASSAVGAGALLLGQRVGIGPPIFLLTPVLQVIAATLVVRATSH